MAKNNHELATKINGNAGSKAPNVAHQIHDLLVRMGPQMQAALPKHLTVERLTRIALTTIRTTPRLLECSQESLLAAVMQAAQLGLEPGLLGQCYFVPFAGRVQFIIGYKGLIDLARRSGQIISIAAGAIYSKDKFKYRKGFEELLEHEPNFQDRGELCGFYAYALTKDGGRFADVMTLQDIEKIRGRSKAANNGPWVTDFEEMGKKTVVRRLAKYLPLSIEVANKIAEDEQKELGEQPIEINLGEVPTEDIRESSQRELEAGTYPAVSGEEEFEELPNV